jgi:hypothetical protein
MNKDNHDWDLDEDGGAFEKKFEEWHSRDWLKWLAENLAFPFIVTREEDDDEAYFTDACEDLFRLGHKMEVVGIDEDDVDDGITAEVKENGKTGYVPLGDLQVKPKTNENFWPVREYVVWFANR